MKKLILLLALICSGPASAALITLEPDDFAAGTDVSNAFEGVTLRSVRHQGSGVHTVGSVVVRDVGGLAPTGTNVFGNGTATGYQYSNFSLTNPNCVILLTRCSGPTSNVSALVMEFDEATDFVSIAAGWTNDGGGLWLFDDDANLIGSCASIWTWAPPCYTHIDTDSASRSYNINLSSVTANIRYAVASGISAGVWFDAITYNAVHVPEPGTAALFCAGVFAVVGLRRRRAHRPEVEGGASFA